MSEAQEALERWPDLTLAVVGGDEREQEIARLAARTGAQVRGFGFPWPEAGIEGVARAQSAADALSKARIALFPIPGMAMDGSIFGTEKIIPHRELLSVMAPRAHIVMGTADDGLRQAAAGLDIQICEYESDQELMLLRAPAIVEAALKVIIENTSITIHNASICVVGQGNIGTVLTRTLIALGGRVTVAARNRVQRAMAYTMGAGGISTQDLAQTAPHFDILLSTVPAPIVDRKVIDRLPQTALVVDLSAPPGGVDLDYARSTGRKAVWARALGRRAPVTVGASQWSGIRKIIARIRSEETAT